MPLQQWKPILAVVQSYFPNPNPHLSCSMFVAPNPKFSLKLSSNITKIPIVAAESSQRSIQESIQTLSSPDPQTSKFIKPPGLVRCFPFNGPTAPVASGRGCRPAVPPVPVEAGQVTVSLAPVLLQVMVTELPGMGHGPHMPWLMGVSTNG